LFERPFIPFTVFPVLVLMQSSFFTAILLPLALAVVMLGMG